MNLPTVDWLGNALRVDIPEIDPATLVGPISIDTRTIQRGDTFWALTGTRDGHKFVREAFAKGAKLAVVSQKWWEQNRSTWPNLPVIRVPDTRSALTMAGSVWRNKLNYPLLGITGSNGKTSSKDLILRVLSTKLRAAGTRGNLNNELGVPLTMLEFSTDHQIAVVEMGASHPGEIADLCAVCRPTHGLVTSIGKAHLEGFGSVDVVAKTKGALYEAVADHGVAFVPTDDELCRNEAEQCKNKIGYGFQPAPPDWSATFHAGKNLRFDENGSARFEFKGSQIGLSVPGKPAAIAALAALSVADHFGIGAGECKAAIRLWQGVHGRAEILHSGGLTIIDDSYNANPPSMLSALETLTAIPGKRHIAILGDMNELGGSAEDEHRKLGSAIRDYRVDHAVFVGTLAEVTAQAARQVKVPTSYYRDYENLQPHLKEIVTPGDVVLVKASRGSKLERVVEQLKRMVG